LYSYIDSATTSGNQNVAGASDSPAIELSTPKNSDLPTSSTSTGSSLKPDEDLKNKDKTLVINNMEPGTSEVMSGNMKPSLSLTELNPSTISTSLMNKESAPDNDFVTSLPVKKSTDTKPESRPNAIVKSVEQQSGSAKKRKKPRKYESSDEEFVLTDEEDDWELTYLKKSKTSSRRARK